MKQEYKFGKVLNMKIDVSINGHAKNCICDRCGEGRKLIQVLRNAK